MTNRDSISACQVDDAIYNTDVYSLPDVEFLALRESIISTYLSDLMSRSEAYARYVLARSPRAALDGRRPPHIPTSVFKAIDLKISSDIHIEKWCVSSGTLGPQSRIGRDRQSLERLLGSVRRALSLFEAWDEEDLNVLHLGPSWEEAGDVWFPYVMGLTELLYPTDSFGLRDRLDLDGALRRFVELRDRGQQVGIIGAPFAVNMFCDAYLKAGLPTVSNSEVAVVTAGGWKTHSGAAIPPDDFRRKISTTLGIAETRVRDAFNQVELNTLFLQCEMHNFHIPPWVSVTAMHFNDLEVLPNGESGLLAYIDASASSYPCVFVGDDVGIVSNEPCPCGRPGDLMTIKRRLERGLDSGCALALSARFAEVS